MGPKQTYPTRNYGVSQYLLTLRSRAKLTQAELASRLGIHRRSVQKWESGETYPTAENLRALIAALLTLGVFIRGQEQEEAIALWRQVSEATSQPFPLFDTAWFNELLAAGGAVEPVPRSTPPTPSNAAADQQKTQGKPIQPAAGIMPTLPPEALAVVGGGARVDWGLAQDVPVLYGRADQLATLNEWVMADRCRVITLVGLGGIGKTSLALTFARQVTSHFEVVIFRSLGEALPLPELLDQLIQRIATQQLVTPPQLSDKLALLIKLLRQSRCLLILDNLETLMQTGVTAAHYLAGYEGYGTLFKSLGETAHQSCLLLTTRERPPELAPLEGPRAMVRSLQVTGLSEAACRTLLADQALVSTPGDAAALARRYGGNPLALKLVAEPIRALFSGDIATFLTEGALFFEGVGQLLEQQISRASPLEQALLTWLAIIREPVGLDGLLQNLTGAGQATRGVVDRSVALAALHALWRRNLIERGQVHLTFTLQRVVMEYLTERLVEQAADEIGRGDLEVLRQHALIQATAKEYVRRSQERVIIQPLLAQLGGSRAIKQTVEAQLRRALEAVRLLPRLEQGYGAGNILNLLAQLGSELRGYDFSHQNIWQANLADVELPDVNFFGADFAGSRFTEAFKTIVPVAFSPDGRYLAAGSIDGEIWLWQVTDNQHSEAADLKVGSSLHGASPASARGERGWNIRQVALLQGHTGPVNGIAFSPDSRILASGSSDGAIMLWRVADSGRLATLNGHRGRVWSVAFSLDGTRLASGSDDQTIKLWSTPGGVCLATLAGHEAPVASVAFNPDGDRLASGSHDPNPVIKLWDVTTGLCTATLRRHTADIWAVAFSPDGALLASGSADLTLRLWSVPTGAHRATLLGHTARIRSLAWSPDGSTLASGSLDQTVKVWDIAALPPPSDLHSIEEELRAVGQTAIIADTTSGVCRMTLAENTGPVNGVAFSPDGEILAGGGELQLIALWLVARQECLALLYGYNSGVLSLTFSPDGATLASAGFDRIIRLWSSTQHTRLARLTGHTGAIYSLAFSPNGKLLASGGGGDDHTLRLWSAPGLTCLSSRLEHRGPVVSVAWSADGQTIASGSLDRTIKLWSPTSPTSMATLAGHTDAVRALAFSPNGALLASASYDRTLRLWDLARREAIQTLEGHTAPARAVTFSPNGRLVASGSADRTIRLWSGADGGCLAILSGHSGEVVSLAFNREGTILASGSFDGTIRLWEISKALAPSSAGPAILEPQTGVIYALAFSPDGRTLASGSAEGAIMLWELPARQPVATMRGRGPYTGMNITAATGLTEAQRATLRALGAVES